MRFKVCYECGFWYDSKYEDKIKDKIEDCDHKLYRYSFEKEIVLESDKSIEKIEY